MADVSVMCTMKRVKRNIEISDAFHSVCTIKNKVHIY